MEQKPRLSAGKHHHWDPRKSGICPFRGAARRGVDLSRRYTCVVLTPAARHQAFEGGGEIVEAGGGDRRGSTARLWRRTDGRCASASTTAVICVACFG